MGAPSAGSAVAPRVEVSGASGCGGRDDDVLADITVEFMCVRTTAMVRFEG